MMTTPFTFEALIFLHSISLVNTSIVFKNLNRFSSYVTRSLNWCTLQKIIRAGIALIYAAGGQPFSRMVSSYLMFRRLRNVFEVFPRKEARFRPRSQANDLVEAIGAVTGKEEAAAKVWERSTGVDEELPDVTYLYLKNIQKA